MENPTRTRLSRLWATPTCCQPSHDPSVTSAAPRFIIEILMGYGALISTTAYREPQLPHSMTSSTVESRSLCITSRLNPNLNRDHLPASATPVALPPRSLSDPKRSDPRPNSARSLPHLRPRLLRLMHESTAFLLATHSRTGILPRSPSYC